jgi:transitional endoplasmic reticulum ATPase
MTLRSTRRTANPQHFAQSPQVTMWMLRIILSLGGIKAIAGPHGFRASSALTLALGLQRWEDGEKFDLRKFRKELSSRMLKLEDDAEAHNPNSALRRNTQRLKQMVGLTDTDAAILELAVLVHSVKPLDDAADLLDSLSYSQLVHVLSVLLDLSPAAVSASLSSEGILARSGLLTVDHNESLHLRGKLDLMGKRFADNLATSDADVATLLRGIVNRSDPAQLSMADFEHAAASTSILLPYLNRARDQARKGVNVLLYGPPGTGKTELVRVLAERLGFGLFEVAYEDGDGDSVAAEFRLRAYRAAQCFFAKQKSILLFDEIEDVFNDGDSIFASRSTAQKRKAWINRALETNPIPTVWVSNNIRSMDPAFLRRFDFVMNLPVPPLRRREQIAREACSGLLSTEAIARLARCEILSPAAITRATSVARLIKDDVGEAGSAKAVEQIINGTLEAQSLQPLHRQDANRLPDVYDPEFIAADSDLAQVAAGLVESRSGRLCLYGPPGTGKTAFGRWLAQQMDAPLLVRRASDLMGAYVGENEKNIAAAFAHASRDGAVLLIDEVDSFLRDRRDAHRNWEASLVNEMLTQMESYEGVFIASTNLMDNLDQAALRRFDLKVKFDYLREDQVSRLFHRYLEKLGILVEEGDDLAYLKRLTQLTPGDFAAVHRRSRFKPIWSAPTLASALAAECALKEPPTRRIGFQP